ncbi:MAG: GIDE domain-containing protein [Candidatus Rifleibacteriota bacterium]
MNNWITVLAGWIILIVAVVSFTNWKKQKKKLKHIVNTPTSKISSLLREKRNTGKMVEVKGKLVIEEPLLSPFTKRKCVFYHSTVVDEVRKVYMSEGRKRQRIYHSTSTDERSNDIFFIEDDTGKIQVDPEGFEIDSRTVLNKKESKPGEKGLNFGTIFKPYGEKIIAVITKEKILPVGQKAYAIGELFVSGSKIFIGSDPLKEKTCFISTKSEEFLVSSNISKSKKNFVVGIVATIVGLSLIYLGW